MLSSVHTPFPTKLHSYLEEALSLSKSLYESQKICKDIKISVVESVLRLRELEQNPKEKYFKDRNVITQLRTLRMITVCTQEKLFYGSM